MKLKTLIATALLAFLPGLSLAMACERDHSANACETGMTWDEASQSCVEQVSS